MGRLDRINRGGRSGDLFVLAKRAVAALGKRNNRDLPALLGIRSAGLELTNQFIQNNSAP